MKSNLQMVSMVLAASLFGAASNMAAADPAGDWQAGMGPGMMGGYGPGYGMMGGYGPGYGMGPGMMEGYGPGYGMMGPGMMGWRSYRGLHLSADQRSRISEIRREMRTKQWAVMAQMMDAQDKLQDLYDADKQDAAAINKQYKAIEELRIQMVDNGVDAHNRIEAILTKEQREKSRDWDEERGYGPMMRGY